MTFKSDTKILIQANTHGGDTSKRFYIDVTINGKRKRFWIPERPRKTKLERTLNKLAELKNLYSYADVEKESKIKSELLKILATKKDLRKKTIGTYKTSINIFHAFFKSRIKSIRQLERNDILEYKEYLKTVYDKGTVYSKLSNIKALINQARKDNKITNNPFEFITLERGSNSDLHRPYSDYELKLIFDHLKKVAPDLFILTQFVYYAYIRPKELLGIKVEHINIRTKTITIPPENSKTKRQRIIPIIKPLYQIIKESEILLNPSSHFIFGRDLKVSKYKSSINVPNSKFRVQLKKLNIYEEKRTTLYGLKHTGNINSYLAGTDIKLIQLINGHGSIATTEIYLRKLGLFLDKKAFEIDY